MDDWDNNELQFARLLSELAAAGITEEKLQDCAVSMDLPRHRVTEILIRAELVFENSKPQP